MGPISSVKDWVKYLNNWGCDEHHKPSLVNPVKLKNCDQCLEKAFETYAALRVEQAHGR